ncbi:hypothetical protein L4N02_27070 [Klebsiella variicola]|nr:hypothetical protein [Klebsiella variicola]MCF7065504.1 hypothetical protein [Klebsiella variicola]MCF7098372.1 hypothetical protein [Klebsiella variicola]
MGNLTDKNNSNNEVTLKVFKDSPHVWAGGLEGRDLADWLIGKANAILYCSFQQEKLDEHRSAVTELEAAEELIVAYADLGLSQQSYDPIHAPDKVAIQFDIDLGREFRTRQTGERIQEGPVPPVGYSLLPDLAEGKEEYQRKKASLLAQVTSRNESQEDE